jgi:hypothetical protein
MKPPLTRIGEYRGAILFAHSTQCWDPVSGGWEIVYSARFGESGADLPGTCSTLSGLCAAIDDYQDRKAKDR